MMLAAQWYHPILATLFAFVAILLMGIILLQRGRGVGLAGAFGGAGGQQAFGSKTGDVLTWATIVVAALFLILAVILNYFFLPTKPVNPTLPTPTGAAPIETGALLPTDRLDALDGATPGYAGVLLPIFGESPTGRA